jgi:hypothetical protein
VNSNVLTPSCSCYNAVRKEQDEAQDSPGNDGTSTPAQRRHRLSWAVLLARVFHFELSVCERCSGTVKVVAALTEPGAIQKYLPGVGLPAPQDGRQVPAVAPGA